MRLSPSAHLDTFCRDRLPPQEQWPEFRFDLPELNYPERLNCAAELLDVTATKVGHGRPCLSSPAGTWTYGQTIRRTNQLAQVLTEDSGLQPGNRVLLRGPNNPWLAAAWLAVIKAGGVAVTTMALLRAREIATIVTLTEPSLAICDHRFAQDQAAPGRRLHRHSPARVHLRARRPAALPAPRGRVDAAHRARHPGGTGRRDRRPRRDRAVHRARGLPGDAGRRQGSGAEEPAALRVGRRAPAQVGVGRVPRGHRPGDHRRHRLDRDVAHLRRRGRS